MGGRDLLVGKMLASNEYDLTAIELPQEKEGLLIQSDVDKTVSIGEEVVVFGNSFGGGVATDLSGKILAVGPQVLETDVKFVSGNSGSPIISKKTHKVLGIASFSCIRKANDFGKDSKFNNVERRFAYRMDNNPSWQQMTLSQFITETLFLKKIEARSAALWDVAHDIARNNKVTRFSYKNDWDDKIDQLLASYYRNIDSLNLGEQSSRPDYKRLHKVLLGDLFYACSSDTAVNYRFCNWHQRNWIEPNRELRSVLKEYFERKAKTVE